MHSCSVRLSWSRLMHCEIKDRPIMKVIQTALAACAALILALGATRHTPSVASSSAQDHPLATSSAAFADRRTSFATVDDYKFDAAVQIVQFNGAHTFSGKLPPMLPAVVVLRITVDERGRITDMWVQRAPEGDVLASKIAMASMRRAGAMPRPLNLANGPDRSLSYSETFLFNADNRFQVRTLAPIQTPD
jgi:protein TonB